MNQPIWILRAGDAPESDLCAEVLRCEGFPWFVERPAQEFDGVPPGVALLILAGGPVPSSTAHRLARAVHSGIPLIAVTPDPVLGAALGVSFGSDLLDAHLVVTGLASWEHGDIPLLCPGYTARPAQGGLPAASLLDYAGQHQGVGLVRCPVGQSQAWLYGYDLLQVIASLRHGSGRLDELPDEAMGPLRGPRHLYSYYELSDKLPRDAPVADLHQDVLRSLMREALADLPLPRLWHFPGGAPAVWMVKGDGCGEFGAEVVIDVVEQGDAFLSFYRPRKSRYPGALLREWHKRGHGISVEADLNHITQTPAGGRTALELNERSLGTIRDALQSHRDDFVREVGLEMDTVCIHSCQWTGWPMADIVHDLGWHMPTHFISHDPRMRRDERYGPYMIPTALPMRYFEPGTGLHEIWHLPAQWDESQTIGKYEDLTRGMPAGWPGFQEYPDAWPFLTSIEPERARAMIGLSAEQYGAVLARFATDAATRWHVVQIANFHPIYVAIPQDHPRASRRALELGIAGAREAGCRFANLEDWSRFVRARAGIQLIAWWTQDGKQAMTIVAPGDLKELALLLPDAVTGVQLAHTGALLPLKRVRLEGRVQRMVLLDLVWGQPTTLYLTPGILEEYEQTVLD